MTQSSRCAEMVCMIWGARVEHPQAPDLLIGLKIRRTTNPWGFNSPSRHHA